MPIHIGPVAVKLIYIYSCIHLEKFGNIMQILGQKEYKDNRDMLSMNYSGLKFIFEKSLLNSITS
jgi:hypothetical protein